MPSASELFFLEGEDIFDDLNLTNSNSSSLDMPGITGHLQVPSRIPTKAPYKALPKSPRSINNLYRAQFDSVFIFFISLLTSTDYLSRQKKLTLLKTSLNVARSVPSSSMNPLFQRISEPRHLKSPILCSTKLYFSSSPHRP